jgi:dTDP-glucose 4,6-dehydratase
MRRILITGGCGFIGSNLVKYLLENDRDISIHLLDALTYAANLNNYTPEEWANPNLKFTKGDVRDEETVSQILKKVDMVIHLAAETHVDRSIDNAYPFVRTDVFGTQVMLESIRRAPVERFIHISTSEVYGRALICPMEETHPLNPQSPYAAAKAGADRLVYAYFLTYKLPVVIIRPFNNYGPYQFPEKVIPLFVTNAIEDSPLPVYGAGTFTRDWLHVSDHCRALERLTQIDLKSVQGEAINLGTGREWDVNYIAEAIVRRLGKSKELVKNVADRPGHVQRHVSSVKKARDILGWEAQIKFEKGLLDTIDWYRENENWWRELKQR